MTEPSPAREIGPDLVEKAKAGDSEALRELAMRSYPVVRRWAATVLGGMGAAAGEAVEPLRIALTDPDPKVARAAKAALDMIER